MTADSEHERHPQPDIAENEEWQSHNSERENWAKWEDENFRTDIEGTAEVMEKPESGTTEDAKFRTLGGSDAPWRDGILSMDFRILRVLEKFPDEDSEETEPLMQPFQSPSMSHSDFCMTPPENQGLLVTPQTPLVPEYTPRMHKPGPGQKGGTVNSHVSTDVASYGQNEDFAFSSPSENGNFPWTTEAQAAEEVIRNSDVFFSLDSEETPESKRLSPLHSALHSSPTDTILPEISSAATPLDLSTSHHNQAGFAKQTLFLSELNDGYHHEFPTATFFTPHGHQRQSALENSHSDNISTELSPLYPSPSIEKHISKSLDSKPKLQRSASAPSWPCETPPHLPLSLGFNASSVNTEGVLVVVPPQSPSLPPPVPTPTNGPSSKPRERRKIRFECDVTENL